jgi:hypothetical protein
MFNVRSDERYEFSDYKVEYTFGFSDEEIFDADLVNANERGLCMLCPHRLAVGQELTLRDFMGYSARTAIVMWITEHKEMGGFGKSDTALFKVGLLFSD